MPDTVKQRIQSLARGLQILDFIADHDRPVRLAELAQLLEIEKSSACRLVLTLADRGYVRPDPETGGYLLDDKVFELAGKLAAHRRVQECARKYLQLLARETGETAHLAVRGTTGVVFTDHEFGDQPVGVTSRWGSSEPFHCTALGKALLAGTTEDELRRLLGDKPLKSYTAKTITRIRDLFLQCRKAHAERLAVDNEEYRPGIRCLASPIVDFRGHIVAAIGISGPADRLNPKQLARHAERVRQSARDLSAELGHRPVA